MFVALSKFAIANGLTAEVKQAFRDRPRQVEGVDGYLRMHVISPLERPDEIWLFTYWRDEASYRAWHGSPAYRASQQHIPKGLKLVPYSTELTFFEHVCE